MFCLQKSSYKSSKWHYHNRTCCVWKESACFNWQKNQKIFYFNFSGEDHDEELNLILQQLGVKLSFTECITYLFSSKRTIKPFLILNSLFLLVRARYIFTFCQWIFRKEDDWPITGPEKTTHQAQLSVLLSGKFAIDYYSVEVGILQKPQQH